MEQITDPIAAQKDKKKTILSWSLYDFANSVFATTIMAGFAPSFFRSYWAAGALDSSEITFWWGAINSIASLIIVFIAPFLGTVADKMGGKKKFLFTFALLGILSTGLLFVVAAGQWIFALIMYGLGVLGFSGANIFYDSLLPAVASEKKIDYVSSLGFSLGYIGGGLLFVVNIAMYMFMPDVIGLRLSFITVAVWWAGFSIPIMLFVKEPKPVDLGITVGEAFKQGWRQVWITLKHIRKLKYVALFLLGYWLYIDGVDTIIRMAIDYGGSIFEEQGLDVTIYLMAALLVTQFVAFPGTLLFNKYAEKVGIKNGVLTAIGAYCVITLLGYFMGEVWHFFALAVMIGLFQGGIQALSRSLYSRLIPEKQAGEFYGFFNMLGKFAAVIGPVMMGAITVATGDIRNGILSLLVLFILGGLLLWKVDMEAGAKMAREYEPED
ncbi:MAG: MFS transporter [Promethearchaeota archaeon]